MDLSINHSIIFFIIIVSLLIIDLFIFSKNKDYRIYISLLLSIFYIIIACLFGIYIYYTMGTKSMQEYYTGYILEKTMSLDNIFVFLIIFKFFNIPSKYQHKVLFLGILFALLSRAIMLLTGIALIAKFDWIMFVFSAILMYTGIKTLCLSDHSKIDIKNSIIYKLLNKYLNIEPKLHGDKFFIKKNNKIYCTPLFMALITIEFMDLIFAIDSIPIILSITQNTYIVYTSNVFAILGLRALFYCLEHIVKRFKYIKYSLGIIIILISIKIIISHFIKIPSYIPLLVTFSLIIGGILLSIIKKRKSPKYTF